MSDIWMSIAGVGPMAVGIEIAPSLRMGLGAFCSDKEKLLAKRGAHRNESGGGCPPPLV
jgi:hypothetical protein